MKKVIGLFAAATMTAMLCTGCFGKDDAGSVATDGSTSMEEVIGSLGEAFTLTHSHINFTYNPTGSGTGIAAVLEGRCDIGLSSRALKDSEKEEGLTATILAYDGIAVIVHPDNPVSDLTIEEIAQIYTGEITVWSAVGGSDTEIVLIGREAGSGTRDGFEAATKTTGKCNYRQELTSTGDIITAVTGNPNAIGYVSVASVKDTVKVLQIDGVVPDEESIRSGSYAIQRPFLLVTKSETPLSEAAQQFFDYVFTEEAKAIITAAGVVPAN